MEKGLIHLYTGDGKGKTTAAIGLAVRAAGAGKQVLFVQFMNGRDTGELYGLAQVKGIEILRSEKDFGFYVSMTEEQKEELAGIHNELLRKTIDRMQSGRAQVIILDEVTYPLRWKLLDEELLWQLLARTEEKRFYPEIVCTGRNAPKELEECADYLTRMDAVRHPYEKGIGARRGIEF